MGVMDKMRRSTGIVLWVLIFSFGILWMLQDTQVFNAMGAGPNSLGSVNGDPISNEEYQSLINQYSNRYSQQTGNSMNAEQRAYYEQQAWDELVTSKLLQQKMDELGVTVTDQEVVDMITGENPDPFIRQQFSREDGTIDRVALNNAIQSQENSQVWIAIEQQMRQKRQQQKMSNYIQSAMRVSNYEVQNQYKRNNTTADISFIRFPYADVEASAISVSDDDLRSYYNNHQDQYERNESYQFEYVAFDKTPTAEDTTRTINDLENLRTDFAETSQDSLFLVRYQSTTEFSPEFVATDEVRDLFKPVLDVEVGEVTSVLKDGGQLFVLKKLDEKSGQVKFAVLSDEIEADPIATIDKRAEEADDFRFFANQDGFSGEAERRGLTVRSSEATKGNNFVAGLGQSRQIMSMLENASEGDLSEPLELPGQFVVVKVNSITPEGTRPFDEVKPQIRTTVQTNKRREQQRQNVAQLKQNNSSLQAIASAAGKEVATATAIPMSAQTIPGAGREPEIVGALYNLPEGTLSQPLQGTSAVFLVTVDARTDPDMSAVQASAMQEVRQQLQQQKNQAFSQVWLEQLKAEADIEDNRSAVLQAR